MKIVILDAATLNTGDISMQRWDALGTPFIAYDRTNPDQLLQRADGAQILLTNKTVLDANTISALPGLRYIGVLATGYNVVDVKAAARHNVIVTNVPAYSTDSVAQLVFAFILEHAWHLSQHNNAVHIGNWQASPDFSFTLAPLTEIASKSIGIIGLGSIGRKVASIAHAFDMNVIASSAHRKHDLPEWLIQQDTLSVFKNADFLTIHCPLTDATRNLVNAHTLSLMKPTAFLINTSRGPVVDEQALTDALNAHTIAGAALDVLTHEPPTDGSPLLAAPNCIITPHIAWATKEARTRLDNVAFSNVQAFLAGQPVNVVNP